MKRVFASVVLLSGVFVQAAPIQKIVLKSGKEMTGYFKSDLPIKSLRDCEKYAVVTNGKNTEFPKDTVYEAKDGSKFLALQGCIYPLSGKLKLTTNRIVDFYSNDSFNLKGNMAFWSDTTEPVPDGEYQLLESKAKFKVRGGQLPDSYYICEKTICADDHN